jgi:hypothetical protein
MTNRGVEDMSKPNKDGWIRHRGGKCPVDAGVKIEIRDRDGDIYEYNGIDLRWSHIGSGGDIMAYRIHKPAEQPAIDPAVVDNVQAFNERAELRDDSKVLLGAQPLKWRDRITEIDGIVEELEEERVALVQRLEGEGFRLIERAVQPAEDMSDWRNWKAGDQVKVILANDCIGLWIDRVVTVRSVEPANYGGSMPVSVFYDDDWNFPEAHDGSDRCVFQFHSRPSK